MRYCFDFQGMLSYLCTFHSVENASSANTPRLTCAKRSGKCIWGCTSTASSSESSSSSGSRRVKAWCQMGPPDFPAKARACSTSWAAARSPSTLWWRRFPWQRWTTGPLWTKYVYWAVVSPLVMELLWTPPRLARHLISHFQVLPLEGPTIK